MELTAAYAERAGVGTLMRRCDARSQLVEATDLDFLQVRFFVGRSMRERRALSTPFSREAGDVFDVSLNFSPSLNDLPDFLTMSE